MPYRQCGRERASNTCMCVCAPCAIRWHTANCQTINEFTVEHDEAAKTRKKKHIFWERDAMTITFCTRECNWINLGFYDRENFRATCVRLTLFSLPLGLSRSHSQRCPSTCYCQLNNSIFFLRIRRRHFLAEFTFTASTSAANSNWVMCAASRRFVKRRRRQGGENGMGKKLSRQAHNPTLIKCKFLARN